MFKQSWTLWREQPLFKAYVVLLLLSWLKQCFNPALLVDSSEYLNAALNLGRGEGWNVCFPNPNCADLNLPETRRTPGYPAMLFLFQFAGVITLFQCLLAALIPSLCIQILKRIQLESSVGILLFFLLIYPLQYYYASMLMPEVICEFLLLLLVIALLDKQWWKAGVCISLLLLLKPVFMPLAWIALFTIPILNGWSRLWMVLPASLVLLVSVINQKNTGLFHYSSIPVTNAFEYNIRPLVKPSAEQYYPNTTAVMDTMGFEKKYQFMQSESAGWIKKYPLTYAVNHAAGAAKALLDPGRYDFIAFFKLPQGTGLMGIREGGGWKTLQSQPPGYLLYIAFFGLIALLKLLMLLVGMTKPIPNKWILLFPIGYVLAVVGPVGSARYILPVMPLMLIFIVAGCQTGLNWLKNK